MGTKVTQFGTLDALRGVAAIGVMAFHEPLLGRSVMPGGYLAVDLFFLLSGFVIAHAYHARMAVGLGPRAFLYRRGIRLWPMLAVGAVLGMVLHGGHAGSLFLLPDFRSPGNLYPANPPLWSLLFELLAYCGFAFGGWRLGTRMLAVIALASAALLAWLALSSGPIADFGAHWPLLAGGFARVGFGFCTGMLIWRLWQARPSFRRVSWLAWLLPLFVLLTLALVATGSTLGALLAIVIAFPATIWLALGWELPQPRLARVLGDISYPLYCIHVPLIAWAAVDSASAVALMLGLPMAAFLLDRLVDRPARKRLGNLLADEAGSRDQTRIGIST